MDKKAKKKKDREAKQKAARKAANRSPFEVLAGPAKDLRVFANGGFEDEYDIVIFARREVSPGVLAIAWFDVATDVSGLRSATGMLDALETEWEELIGKFHADAPKESALVPISADRALSILLGGARVAADNGLRLPEKWDRWASVIGPADGWKTAAIDLFEPSFEGDLSELSERLVGYTLEAFLARTDIDIHPYDDIGHYPEGYFDDTPASPEVSLDGLEDADEFSPEALLGKEGETVSPEFDTAQRIHLQAGIAAFPDTSRDLNMTPSDSPLWQKSIDSQIAALPAERRDEVRSALAQYERYCKLVGSLEVPDDVDDGKDGEEADDESDGGGGQATSDK